MAQREMVINEEDDEDMPMPPQGMNMGGFGGGEEAKMDILAIGGVQQLHEVPAMPQARGVVPVTVALPRMGQQFRCGGWGDGISMAAFGLTAAQV
jgi:hypothetical protein